jgi:hypothetical protein
MVSSPLAKFPTIIANWRITSMTFANIQNIFILSCSPIGELLGDNRQLNDEFVWHTPNWRIANMTFADYKHHFYFRKRKTCSIYVKKGKWINRDGRKNKDSFLFLYIHIYIFTPIRYDLVKDMYYIEKAIAYRWRYFMIICITRPIRGKTRIRPTRT